MKKILFVIISLIFIQYHSGAQDLSLEKILDKYYKENAFDKLQKVNTIIMTGSITRNDLMPYKITKMRPDKYRLDFMVADLEAIQAYDGKDGWSTAPWTGDPKPTLMNEDTKGAIALKADFNGILYHWKEKGHKVELVGKDTIEGKVTYKIKVERKDGGKEFYFIDTKDFMLLKQSSLRKYSGQEIEVEVFYKDYKKVEGIWFAYTIETKMGGQAYSLVEFEKVELKVPVDKKLFTMP